MLRTLLSLSVIAMLAIVTSTGAQNANAANAHDANAGLLTAHAININEVAQNAMPKISAHHQVEANAVIHEANPATVNPADQAANLSIDTAAKNLASAATNANSKIMQNGTNVADHKAANGAGELLQLRV